MSLDKIESTVVQIVVIILPLITIPAMYGIMTCVIVRNKLRCKRFFITSSAIILTSILAYLPSALTSMFEIPMSYEFAQISTVTLYYSNSIINPIIYFALHPKTKSVMSSPKQVMIKQGMLYKTRSMAEFSSAVSVIHNVASETSF